MQRASDLDARDPLPHYLRAQIARDRFAAAEALSAARTAARLMPNLKSLDQLANDRKGSANIGSALAFFGLEAWAMSLAQQAYHPYWAGSPLFLAERYPGGFARQSELMKGFLLDPTVFGSGTKASPLIAQPGTHLALGMSLAGNEDAAAFEPSFTANGLTTAGGRPLAWFIEGLRTEMEPRAHPFAADAGTLSVGLGITASELAGEGWPARLRRRLPPGTTGPPAAQVRPRRCRTAPARAFAFHQSRPAEQPAPAGWPVAVVRPPDATVGTERRPGILALQWR